MAAKHIKIPSHEGESKQSPSRPLFARGLALFEDWIWVGISPATVLCIDWRSGELIDMFSYSMDVDVCIHGLAVSPN
jgi:hypothetical protein